MIIWAGLPIVKFGTKNLYVVAPETFNAASQIFLKIFILFTTEKQLLQHSAVNNEFLFVDKLSWKLPTVAITHSTNPTFYNAHSVTL